MFPSRHFFGFSVSVAASRLNGAMCIDRWVGWRFLFLIVAVSGSRREAAAGEPAQALQPKPLPTPYIAKPTADSTNPAADWYVCARRGAQLRAACRSEDKNCFDDVDGKIVDCYRAVYAKRVDTVGNRLELLGPRFAFERKNAVAERDGGESYRQEGDPKYLSPRRFAEAICSKQLADVPRKPCIKELLFGVESLVWMGGFGAGP